MYKEGKASGEFFCPELTFGAFRSGEFSLPLLSVRCKPHCNLLFSSINMGQNFSTALTMYLHHCTSNDYFCSLWMKHSLFNQSSTVGHLAFFYFFHLTNNAIVHFLATKLGCTDSPGEYLRINSSKRNY